VNAYLIRPDRATMIQPATTAGPTQNGEGARTAPSLSLRHLRTDLSINIVVHVRGQCSSAWLPRLWVCRVHGSCPVGLTGASRHS
jgi:hypothetical protein